MNSSPEGPQINFELPQPASPEAGQEGQEQAAEAPPALQEQVGKQAPKAMPLPPLPDDIPAAGQPVVAAPPQDVASSGPGAPHTAAHDTDHIEPVWVNKVKDVIASTQDDPYRQKDQMSRVKAEYIQKRFNKTIKTDEAAA